ncbi:hypothetical protein ACOSP7_021356 [Xanthoceras sorbifolium]
MLAKPLVNEVRRQFIERPSIMEYKKKLDYRHCVAIVAFVSLCVEDPFKDTVRHSLHILIKIFAMITLIMAAVFLGVA